MKNYPKYLVKLIIFSLVLVSLPVIALGTFTSLKTSDIIQSKVTDSNMQVMVQTRMRIEQTLKTVDSTIVPFLNSTALGKAMDESYEKYNFETYDEISKSLYSLQSNDLPFYNVYLVNLKKQWIINTKGLYRFDEFQNKDEILKYSTYDKPSFWIREDKNPKFAGEVNGYSSIDGICMVKKAPINALNASGLVVVQIRQAELDKFIIKSKTLGQVMVVDNTSHILYSDNDEMRGKDISFLPYIQKVQQLDLVEGSFEIYIDNGMKVVTFSKSQYNGWVYLSILSKEAVLKESHSIMYLNLLICLFVLVLSGILSVFMSKMMYNPIGKIYESIKDNKKDDKANIKDELQFIGESLNVLITDNYNMTDQLQGRKQQIKEYLVMKLFQSQIRDEDIDAKMSIFPDISAWKFMNVVSIYIYDFEVESYDIKDKDLILFAISNVVGEIVPQEHQLCPVIVEDYVTILIGGSFELTDIFKNYVYSLANTIQENLANYLGVKVDIGVSRTFEKLNFAYKAFNESKEALKYRIRTDHETVIFAEDVQADMPLMDDFPKAIDKAIIEAIKFGDKPKAELLMHEFIGEIIKNRTSINKYQVSLLRLIIDIVNILPDGDATPIDEYMNGKTFIDNINELKSSQQIEEWLINNILTPVFDKISGDRLEESKNISAKIISIIENEYDKDLGLELCAARLHYHPNYIRRVFVEETGTTFSEYLSQFRINIARKWLLETDMKIHEIAEKLRYNNAQNFIRSFRKKEGITPGEFRNKNSKFF